MGLYDSGPHYRKLEDGSIEKYYSTFYSGNMTTNDHSQSIVEDPAAEIQTLISAYQGAIGALAWICNDPERSTIHPHSHMMQNLKRAFELGREHGLLRGLSGAYNPHGLSEFIRAHEEL